MPDDSLTRKLGYRSVMDPEQRSAGEEVMRGALRSLLGLGAGAADLVKAGVDAMPFGAGMAVARQLAGVPWQPSASASLDAFMGAPDDPSASSAYSGGNLLGEALGLGLGALLGPIGLGTARIASRSALGGSLRSQAGAITPEGHAALIRALERRGVDEPFVVGTLEPKALGVAQKNRAKRGWPSRRGDEVAVTQSDIDHMLKRIDVDGMTPEEVARLAEEVLSPHARPSIGDLNRVNLTGGRNIDVRPGEQARPIGILEDRAHYPRSRLYGLIPKGWPPQK